MSTHLGRVLFQTHTLTSYVSVPVSRYSVSLLDHFRRQQVCSHISTPYCKSSFLAPQASGAAEKRVLGIESSCDDTGVAVVTTSGKVLGEVLVCQDEVHREWGGVVPNLAREAHHHAIEAAVSEAMTAANLEFSDLDAVAVTVGPGLSPCLQVGARKARSISFEHHLPIVHCHHMEAHALVARMRNDVKFPFLCLLVSGGHNLLLVVKGVGDYVQAGLLSLLQRGIAEWDLATSIVEPCVALQMGTTLDDSIGESFDKVARMLGLDAMPSGGPELERFAKLGDPHSVSLTMPLANKKTCNFSYSGLKTSVLLAIEERASNDLSAATQQMRADIAASFQHVAIEQLVHRLKYAMLWAREEDSRIDTLVVAGGVAANQCLRTRIGEVASDAGYKTVYPEPRFCTDNGVMVAWAGLERLKLGLQHPPVTKEEASEDWVRVNPRWPLTSDLHPRCATPQTRKRKLRVPKKASKLPSKSLTDMTRAAMLSDK